MGGCVALIVAAGQGERFGAERPKQYLELLGQPLLRRSVLAFLRHPLVTGVQVVIQPAHRALYDAAVGDLDLPEPVAGGAARQESCRLGLEALDRRAPGGRPQRVLIHDAARPLIDAATITRVIAALTDAPGAIAALPVVDTLKRDGGGFCAGTVPRVGLWRAQTPQGFRFDDILAAHRRCAGTGTELTDDAAVAESAGLGVALVHGHPDNLKVTTTEDLARAARLLAGADALAAAALPLTGTAEQAVSAESAPGSRTGRTGGGEETRTGLGFDVHRLIAGDHVTLCGVRIPHTARLEGHSDADVGLHALVDALLGAIGAGDIGSHFPPSEARWRGADSGLFVRHAVELVRQRGGRIVHVDVTLICERPKIGPHRPAMVARLAALLEIDPERVSVKATTTEQLGFTGRGEGIAAQAIATVAQPPPHDITLM